MVDRNGLVNQSMTWPKAPTVAAPPDVRYPVAAVPITTGASSPGRLELTSASSR